MDGVDSIREVSSRVAEAIEAEADLQRNQLLMIASENFASEATMAAQGSVLTNRNALGYPDDRLYPGAENIDAVEEVAVEAAEELWGADHVNVQPHSGSLANLAVYLAVLDPGDRILSLDPRDGGHVTHGADAHVSGDLYEVAHYRVDPETGRVDYEDVRERAVEFDPDLVVSGFSAYPRSVDWERVQAAADATDAYHLADIAHLSGLVAAGELASPVGVADFATASTYKTIRAGRGGMVLCDAEHADAVDAANFPGLQGGASMPNIAGKAVGFREALTPEFDAYAAQLVANARRLASRLESHGLDVVSGGTDTHIVLVDLRSSHPELTGGEAEAALERAGVVVTAASVPGDERYPEESSGVRLGTPPLTSRGFEEREMEAVGDFVAAALDAAGDEDELAGIRADVEALCADPALRERP